MLTRFNVTTLTGLILFASLQSYANEKAPTKPTSSNQVSEFQVREPSPSEAPTLLAVRRPITALRNSKFTFRLPDLEGNTVTHADKRFNNKVVLYDIWGTWCSPCREMTPFLKKLHADYASDGLVIVGIAFEKRADVKDPKKTVADYVAENEIEYLTLYGGVARYASDLVFKKLSFREFDDFPTVVIVGKNGKVKRIEDGYDEKIAERTEALIRELLKLK